MTLALTVRISVFGSPVLNRSGMACLYRSQFRNESSSCDSVDFGAAAAAMPAVWCSAAIAAKSGSCGAGAAFDPGFHPGGKARGTQSEYSRAQVPSAMIASSPEFSASISGWFSLATAHATKLSKLKVFSMICGGIAGLHGALRLLRRRHPRVDLARLEAGVDGVVVGELHRLQVQRVDDVGLLHGALHDADALAGGQLVEAGDGRPDGTTSEK